MSTSIKELSGRAFLAFPEWSEVLLSELKNRFGITVSPSARYGDLFYFEDIHSLNVINTEIYQNVFYDHGKDWPFLKEDEKI